MSNHSLVVNLKWKIFQINGIFIGIQAIRYKKRKTISLNQRNYINDILKRFCLQNWKPISTLLDISFRLCKIDEPMTIEEATKMEGVPYREALGCLMYPMVATRPNIML